METSSLLLRLGSVTDGDPYGRKEGGGVNRVLLPSTVDLFEKDPKSGR